MSHIEFLNYGGNGKKWISWIYQAVVYAEKTITPKIRLKNNMKSRLLEQKNGSLNFVIVLMSETIEKIQDIALAIWDC